MRYSDFSIGVLVTLSVFFVSVCFGTFIGLTAAGTSLSRSATLRQLAAGYVSVIRGVPELLIILVVFFGGTAGLSAIAGRYVEVNAFAAGAAALTIVFGGYAAEIFRGAIMAIPRGQTEAALALGLPRLHRWMLVIVPQMLPLALPAYGNLCISLIKDTALVSIVGLSDIMRVAYVGAGSNRAPLPYFLAASAIYLALTSIALLSFTILERKFEYRGRQR